MRTSILLFSTLLLLTSCARRAATPAVQLLSRDALGMVTLYSDGEGYVKKAAETDAQKRVLKRILFDGINHPEISALRLPLIDQTKLSATQQNSLNAILDSEEIDRFFQDVTWVDPKTVWASGQTKLQRYKMTLNYDLFRKTLESKGVIRKFGI